MDPIFNFLRGKKPESFLLLHGLQKDLYQMVIGNEVLRLLSLKFHVRKEKRVPI